jgi:putative ABC transport system permease protein
MPRNQTISEDLMCYSYLKLALKVLARRPFFTVVSLLGIGFTLVVLVAASAALDCIVGPYPPETRGDRILKVTWVMLSGGTNGFRTASIHAAGPELARRVRALETPQKVSVYARNRQAVSYQGGDETVLGMKRTDAAYWEIMDFHFLEGRAFTQDEDASAAPVAVITRDLRQGLFGGQPALGQMLEAVTTRYRVVGVVANVPRPIRDATRADFWVPLGPLTRGHSRADLLGDLNMLLLADKEADSGRIRAELATRLTTVDLSGMPEYDRIDAFPETELEALALGALSPKDRHSFHSIGQARLRLLGYLAAAALLVMLLPALNLINLNVSRIMERASEIGVRKAFGAPSRELVRQFVVENLVLTLVGGAVGLALASGLLTVMAHHGWWFHDEFHMNYRIFLYGLLAAVVFGVISGVYPAWRMSRLHPAQALRGGSR